MVWQLVIIKEIAVVCRWPKIAICHSEAYVSESVSMPVRCSCGFNCLRFSTEKSVDNGTCSEGKHYALALPVGCTGVEITYDIVVQFPGLTDKLNPSQGGKKALRVSRLKLDHPKVWPELGKDSVGGEKGVGVYDGGINKCPNADEDEMRVQVPPGRPRSSKNVVPTVFNLGLRPYPEHERFLENHP